MKKIILGLKNNYLIYGFVILGAALIAFSHQLVDYVPYILGPALIVYACVNAAVSLKYPTAKARPGYSLIQLALGVVILLQRDNALGVIGIVWAMLSLQEAAEELDEFHRTRKISVVRLLGIVATSVLAFMLLHDPFGHFIFHMRVLGLEMIAAAFVRWRRGEAAEAVAHH